MPIPMLVLRNTPDESSSVVHWLMAGCPQRAILPDGRPENGIAFDPALIPVTVPGHLPNGRGPRKLRDCQLLAALLSGACLTGNARQSSEPIDSPTCGQHEYERVRRLLQSPLVNTADEPVDQLAVDMINRANIFLKLKDNAEFIYAYPSLCGYDDPIDRQRGSRTRQELVTRREIADLGNVRCRLIQQVVEFLRSAQDGHNAFRRMGLVRQSPSERGFKGSETRALTVMLRPWSPKQVRGNFDALRKTGLIDGDRESGNAPWQYRLPEALSTTLSPFRSLPPAIELFGAHDTSFGTLRPCICSSVRWRGFVA
ncbi:MAG: hypothetical protein IID44_17205 [Planctomycetes bacterium]|nr:hypothetical protein [Planctomycetota bacterium]